MRLSFITFLAALLREQLNDQAAYLQCENRILHKRLGHYVRPNPQERHELLKYGKPLGLNLKPLITIVRFDTFQRWVRQENDPDYRNRKRKKRGRPLKDPAVRSLVLEMARDNIWGYTRILGELYKLNIFRFSRTTIGNILKKNGLPPRGERTEPWMHKIKRHCDTLIACDFFRQWVWTLQGPRAFFILFFINIQTRQVRLAGIAKYPKADWVLEQTKRVFQSEKPNPAKKALLIHDLDGKFPKEFDEYFKAQGFSILKTPYRSPNLNAHAESWVDKIRSECLNHFVIFGVKHLQYLVNEYVNYHNTQRPHMAKGCRPLVAQKNKSSGQIRASPILGGLHHHYFRE